jgi:hypothetical protein
MPKTDLWKDSGRNCHTNLIVMQMFVFFFLHFLCHSAEELVERAVLDMSDLCAGQHIYLRNYSILSDQLRLIFSLH